MLFTPYAQIPSHAPVENFSLLRNKVLSGNRLRDVRALQDSIELYGLLCPIIAMQRSGRLVVVDGRKRLAAIKRLQFEGRLPRPLTSIPYLLVSNIEATERRAPLILANIELYTAVAGRFHKGTTIDELTAIFNISHQCVRDILTLSRLIPRIRTAFFCKRLSFSQARAFAAIPNPRDQARLFDQLDPLATVNDILARGLSQTAAVTVAVAA